MKLQYLLIPLGLIALGVLAIGAYNAASAPLPQGFPPPTPEGQIEVKSYPAYRAATYRYSGELSQAANAGFGPLYNHISANEISMTAPVETRYPTTLDSPQSDRGEAIVSFLYRSTEVAPQKVAQNIEVEDIAPMTVLSIGLRGEYSYQSYQENLQRLQNWLNQHPEYTVVGSPRRFFYDGPYIPDPLKRSEIQIPVEQTER